MENTILSVEKNKTLKVQQDVWRADIKLLEEMSADIVDEVRKLRSEFYQIAAICLVFQGVIITAVAQSNRLTCAQVWSPIYLSVAVVLAAILTSIDKIAAIGDGERHYAKLNDSIGKRILALDQLNKLGSELKLKEFKESNELTDVDIYNFAESGFGDGEDGSLFYSEAGREKIFSWAYSSILIFLLVFSILVEILSYKALCDNSPCSSTRD